MKWGQYFTSAIGKKIVMAFTGIFLILFLIFHCSANACIFVPDHGATFNKVAHFLGTNWIMHILELGLFVGFIHHIVQGIVVTIQNRTKRPVKYAVNRRNQTSNWYSRSMGLLGVLILIFLVIHLSQFWVHTRFTGGLGEVSYDGGRPMDDLYGRMKLVFSHGWVVIVYLAGLIALGWHLAHGFQSAFRTLGMTSSKYIPFIRGLGFAFSIVVPLIFALMPVLMYVGVVN
jgi:succinate dehydrogenase / fumarate reductase cytochrome b subunit